MTDKEIEQGIEKAASKIDGMQINTPELLQLSALVNAQKQLIEKRQKRQFLIFIAVIALIAAVMSLCFFAGAAVFAAVQAVPLAVFAVLYFRSKRTGVRL